MKIKDIVAVIGSYVDQNGQQKKNFRTVGELHQNANGQFILMDKSFNLASVQQSNPNDAKVVLSLYDPKPRQQQQGITAQQYRDAKNGVLPPEQVHASFASQAPTDAFDDEIPF